MLRNFDEQVKLLDGTPVYDGDYKDAEGTPPPLTIRRCIVSALVMTRNDAHNGEEMLKRFALAEKVSPGGDIDLTIDEISLIKSVSEKAAPTALVYGLIVKALSKEKE